MSTQKKAERQITLPAQRRAMRWKEVFWGHFTRLSRAKKVKMVSFTNDLQGRRCTRQRPRACLGPCRAVILHSPLHLNTLHNLLRRSDHAFQKWCVSCTSLMACSVSRTSQCVEPRLRSIFGCFNKATAVFLAPFPAKREHTVHRRPHGTVR